MGGGLAGLATSIALGTAGYRVDLFESRPFLGGRATSYPLPGDSNETIDNCQHILLRCCVNLLDFYSRLDIADAIEFHREFFYLTPGQTEPDVLRAGKLPAPLHFAESFARAGWLSFSEKLALGRALLALKRERTSRTDLDRITMLDWLREKRQPQRLIDRFWNQILVSAINEDLDRMAASHGFQVFWLGFLADSTSYEMGVPRVPLGHLYSASGWDRLPNVRIHSRATVDSIDRHEGRIESVRLNNGERYAADHYVSALPFEKLRPLIPDLPIEWDAFTHSPITGVHLWFDRPVTKLPHATLLDRTVQWFFNKDSGRYLQLVISASRAFTEMPRQEVIDLCVRELGEFLPEVRTARLEKAHVVKEIRATFSAAPGLESKRPEPTTIIPNLFLAGDWTRSGWPATMEGAVRSGYRAAEAILGEPGRFLLPDIA